ncbi:MAG TPA: TerC/Alx family metal homeostasis membrane protein [Methylomirabilota bacterium]|nr:TerC/Alx family metal homeostasis membrane protein [Methylomirabilota bacterium]
MPTLFPIAEFWWLYGGFIAVVLGLLALDLGVLHRDDREVGVREAAVWCVVWVVLALLFNAGLYVYVAQTFDEPTAWQVALEFLTGYVVEYSLSVDNIFVFVVVLGYFGVPARYQHRVLFYGILGALVFRAVFIALGSVLMQIHWIVVLFGVFLVFTGLKLAWTSAASVDPPRNLLLRLLRRILPVTSDFEGPRFVVRRDGRWWATPLLVALVCLEATDVVFAVDSVPAIFGLTREPFVVFSSNIFAILGLRSMYFMLGGAVGEFHLLRYGLAAVLVFVGLKMVWLDAWFGGKFPIALSLGIIGSVLAASVILSLLQRKGGARPSGATRAGVQGGGGIRA